MKIIATFRRLLLPGFLGVLILPLAASAQTPKEEFVPKPDALEVHGVPPIPASLAKAVAPYTAPFGYTLAGWDPVKREIRVKLVGGGPAIYRIEEPGGRLRLWKQLFVSPVYDVYPDPKETCLIYNKDTDGNEAFQMYLYDFKTFKSTLLSDPGSRNTEFVWSHASDRVVYSRSKASEGPGVSLYVMDPRDPKTNRLLFKSEGNYIKAYDWFPDDRMITVCEFYSQSDSRLWLLDINSNKKTLLSTSRKILEYYGGPQFGKDGKGIYVATDYRSNMRRLAYFNFIYKRFSYFTTDKQWDVDGFKVSPDGLSIAYTFNVNGYSKLYVLNISTGKSREILGLPVGIISSLLWHGNSKDLAFDLKSPQVPNNVYSIDIKSGKVDLWVKSVMNGLNIEDIVMPELTYWESYDKQKIPGFVYRPPSKYKGKRPVIVSLHGGPTEQYRPRFDYEHNYYLNELGVAWVYPNFRGSTGYGKHYLHSDNGFGRTGAARDVKTVLDWIASQPDLDSERVMVRGGSYGGYLALTIAYLYGHQVRCIVSSSGLSHLAKFMEKIDPSRLALQRAEFGDERSPRMMEFMERIAPLTHSRKIQLPLLVVHGKNDPIVSISDARLLVQAVTESNNSVWYIFASNEGHDMGNYSNWRYSLCASILFAQHALLVN